ncbi:MAG: hypothetical protein AB8B48_18970 [Pseudomonadales bacterium]
MQSLNQRASNAEINKIIAGGGMRNFIYLIMALVIAVTCWPTDSFAQSNTWHMLNQQRMNNQRMQDQQRRNNEMQRQQRESQRRQQETQRRQMQQQRERQQAVMQQRQRDMQVRKQQMQAQRQKIADERRIQQQKRQQETQRKQVQRQQTAQKATQQTARIARDRAVQLQRDRRLQQLRQRTRLQQQQQQTQRTSQQTSTIALLSRTANRATAINSQSFTQKRQEAAQRFAKLRASRPAVAAGGSGKGNGGAKNAIIIANKQFQRQKLQEFRNRQALKGPKETKQDAVTKNTGKEVTPVVVSQAPPQLKFKPTTGIKINTKKNVTTTVLGNYEKDIRHIVKELKYPKTLDFRAKKSGYNILNTPNTLYKSPKQFWDKYNKPFLDKAIKRGDRILLASKPTDVNNLRRENLQTGQVEKTGFAKEIEYLRNKGYKYDPLTSSMVPK